MVQDANKNMAIFELEQSLQQQAESFTNQINERDDRINKVSVYTCDKFVHTAQCYMKMHLGLYTR